MKQERWNTVPKREQLLHMGAAILRAASFQKSDPKKFFASLREAEQLLLLSIADPKWSGNPWLPRFHAELNEFARGERTDSIKILYEAL